MMRVTRGVHELRAVDAVLEAVHRAGWRGREAVLQYAAFSNFLLSTAAHNAARLVNQAAEGREGWIQEYHPADPTKYPFAEAAKDDLRALEMAEVFTRTVDIVISAMDPHRPGH